MMNMGYVAEDALLWYPIFAQTDLSNKLGSGTTHSAISPGSIDPRLIAGEHVQIAPTFVG